MFAVKTDDLNQVKEFDEQVRIIESGSMESAFYKARSIGRSEEETFTDINKNKFSWKFIDVSEIYAVSEVKDGEQLYSNTHHTNDSNSFMQYIRQKSMEIQTKNLTFA